MSNMRLKIDFGITLYPGETFVDAGPKEIVENLNYIEYKVNSVEDAQQCRDHLDGRIIHGPDPQEDNWIDIISEISQLKHVEYGNVHARPTDEYALCNNCFRRIMIMENKENKCSYCETEPWIGNNNDFNSLIEKLNDASEILTKKNKKLLIENTYETPELMHRIMNKLPNCGFTFDIGHSLIFSSSPLDYIYILKNQIRHLHLHDNMGGCSERFHDRHDPCGMGIAPWNEFIFTLRNIGFNGTATFECDIASAPKWFDNFRNTLGFS